MLGLLNTDTRSQTEPDPWGGVVLNSLSPYLFIESLLAVPIMRSPPPGK